ncbi:MAG: hypothetical protein IJL01_02035 [Synergistaceae bacterium]|nr:hypothetical protein [Synergistaceae bacterium]
MNIEKFLDNFDLEEMMHMLRQWELYGEGYRIGLEEGKRIGLEQGKREVKFETAKQMLQMGKDDSFIHHTTELSLEKIKSIQTNEG